jgi:hypothetical protein
MSKSHHRGTRAATLVLLALVALPTLAQAQQTQERSYWGVGVSYVPLWRAHEEFQNLLLVENADQLLEGTEFAIGVARGKTYGGHWTLSYVSKPFKNATVTSVEEETSQTGQGGTFFSRNTTTTTFTDVKYRGIEGLKYINFVTIKRRAQVGMTAGGGIAWPEGTVTEVSENYFRSTASNGQVFEQTDTHTETQSAEEAFYKIQPLFKLELQGTFIIMPGLKFTAAWGLNSPGIGYRIGGIYLFGAK